MNILSSPSSPNFNITPNDFQFWWPNSQLWMEYLQFESTETDFVWDQTESRNTDSFSLLRWRSRDPSPPFWLTPAFTFWWTPTLTFWWTPAFTFWWTPALTLWSGFPTNSKHGRLTPSSSFARVPLGIHIETKSTFPGFLT